MLKSESMRKTLSNVGYSRTHQSHPEAQPLFLRVHWIPTLNGVVVCRSRVETKLNFKQKKKSASKLAHRRNFESGLEPVKRGTYDATHALKTRKIYKREAEISERRARWGLHCCRQKNNAESI